MHETQETNLKCHSVMFLDGISQYYCIYLEIIDTSIVSGLKTAGMTVFY